MSEESTMIEKVARAMLAASRPNADPDAMTPAPRGQLGMMPTWKLYEHLARAAINAMSDVRGTAECPYCGDDTPHHHESSEIAKMVRGLPERLGVLADEMLKVGFYSAAHRAYGTDYSNKAEKMVARDLKQAVAKIDAALERVGLSGGGGE